MRLYLVRHGETELNERKCYYGLLDPELNEKGRKQAEVLRDCLKDVTFDHVIASPLTRAADTARIIAGHCKTDARLCEQSFGVMEGLTYEEIMEQCPEVMHAWNQDFTTYRIPDGESFLDVRARVDDFLESISDLEGTVLITAHKGTLGHLLAGMLHMPPEGYWNFVFEQGCYNVVDIEDGYAIIRKLNQSV